MTEPTFKVELSLDPPLVESPTWLDISNYVIDNGIQSTRGRNSELERFQAGNATVQLNNKDGRFDPAFAGDVRNLVTNPSAEVDIVGYSSNSSTISRQAVAAFIGGFGIQVVTTNVVESGIYRDNSTLTSIIPGQTYTFSLYARRATAGSGNWNVQISWWNGEIFISTSSTNISLSSTTYTRFFITATAPVGATSADLLFLASAAPGVITIYTDAWQFEPAASPSTYCDGTQAGCFWEGAAHASASHHGGGPYWPNLRPMNRMRISATYAAVDYPQFYGYVQSWPPAYPDLEMSVVDVELTDGFAVLAIPELNVIRPYSENDPSNLLANPSFEDDLTDYVSVSSTISVETTQILYGLQSMQVDTGAASNSGVDYAGSENIVVNPRLTYTFSLFIYIDTASSRSMLLRLRFNNEAGTINTVAKIFAVPARKWTRLYVSGVAGAGVDRAELNLRTNVASAFTFYTDGWCLAQEATNMAELPEELSGARINRVLDAIGWPAANRSISAGSSMLLAQSDLRGVSALTYLQTVEQSEQGRLWMGKDGSLSFLSRWDLGQSPYTASEATFGQTSPQLPYVELTPQFDLSYVYNEVRLTGIQDEAVEQVATDATSIARYGLRSLSISGLLVSDNELRDASYYIVSRYKEARKRITTLTVVGEADPANLWPKLLGLELSRRITVVFTPPGQPAQTQECFIEGVRQNWTRPRFWRTIFTLSSYGIGDLIYPAGKTFFALGTSALTTGTGVLVY